MVEKTCFIGNTKKNNLYNQRNAIIVLYLAPPGNRSPTDVMMWTVFIDLTNICDTMKSYREEEERLVGCGGEVPGRQCSPAPGRRGFRGEIEKEQA